MALRNGIEIGIFKQASPYFMRAILQRAFRDFKYHMVDIHDGIVGFDA